MWIALISALFGAAAVLAPPILNEVIAARADARELARLKLEGERRRAAGDEAERAAKRPRPRKKVATPDPAPTETGSGFPAIDRLNALLAPAAACTVLALFVIVGLFYSLAIVEKYREGQLVEIAELSRAIWDSLVGQVVQAVLGYLFGYHLTRAAVDRTAPGRRER